MQRNTQLHPGIHVSKCQEGQPEGVSLTTQEQRTSSTELEMCQGIYIPGWVWKAECGCLSQSTAG